MEKEHKATVRGFNLPISKKFSVEIASFIRRKRLTAVKVLLQGVLDKKVAVPMKRFNRDQAHKRGPIAAGRYPYNATKQILKLLHSAEMNAQDKGLDIEALYISSIIVNKGVGAMRYGRQRGREAKRTHIEIVLQERELKKKAKKNQPKKGDKKE
jgi:large subunit ribosomal protein L22